MSQQDKNLFTILEKVGESKLKIQEKVPESVAEQIEIAKASPAKSEDGQPGMWLKTTQGREFARLDNWPEDLLLEIKQS